MSEHQLLERRHRLSDGGFFLLGGTPSCVLKLPPGDTGTGMICRDARRLCALSATLLMEA